MLAPQTAVSLAEAQDLIFLEAELLDAWRLDDWIKLYTRRHDLSGPLARHAGRCVAGYESLPHL